MKPTTVLPPPGAATRAFISGSSWRWALAIFAVTLLAYWPALHGKFVWDDEGHITRYDLRSLGGLARIWFEVGATQQYYPVLHSAFWLEYFVFGTTPAGYHVLNVLLHATAACLFARLLRRLNVPGAGLAACFFALHPVCVESVAWISEQKNTLSTVFYLLAALAYLRFHDSRRTTHYLAASLCFFLALGTKTVTGTLPATLLVIFWWQRGRLDLRREVAPLAPWFVLAAAAGVTTAWVEHTLIGAQNYPLDLDLVQRGLLASRVIWFYLGKLIYPANLVFIYPRWAIDAGAAWQYLFPLGILLVAAGMWRWRRHRGPIAAGLIFAGSLFPALGFVNIFPFVFSFVADHFQYLASLAIFALAGAGLASVFARWPASRAWSAALGLLAAFAVLTWRQSATYRDLITFYQSTIAKNPGAWMAHNNLGDALIAAGRPAEAIPHLQTALKLRPESVEIENNFGHALLRLKDPVAALPHFERAQRLRPDYVYAYANLGRALMMLGRAAEAETQLRTALRLKPDYPEANLTLGLLFAQRGDTAGAIQRFTAALQVRPDLAEAELNLGIALVFSKRANEALPHFARAARLEPGRPDIQFAFGRAFAVTGRLDQAIARYRQALQLAPGFADAHFYLATALRETGSTTEAADHFAEAARLGMKK